MRRKIGLILIIVASLIFLNPGLNLAQGKMQTRRAQALAPSEPEVEWLLGEVVSVDTQNRALLVKYFDYEKEIENEISINIDDKTTYEDVKSLDEIKPKDFVSIDYIISGEGRNIAKNISVEKPEEIGATQEKTIEEPLKETPANQ